MARSRSHCCSGNATIYFVLIFSDYRISGTIFGEKIIGGKMCVLILSTAFV
jgi:hypothetical protein